MNAHNNASKNSGKTGKLYIVATPIGNLDDITRRAIDTLQSVDIIACEDTRTSAKLLTHYNITKPTWAYHEHNADVQTAKFIELLQTGKSIALISDAGTPLVSDPGYRLVKACHDHHVSVSPIAGASAAIAGLSVAGLPSDRFYFVGFLPAKTVARQNELTAIKDERATLIVYEAPHRIVECLSDILTVFGERDITLCRELTKTFETIKKTNTAALLDFVKNNPNQQKGEIVLVIAGNTAATAKTEEYDTWLNLLAKELPPKKAAAIVAEISGIKKSVLYDRLMVLSGK
ncbi:MAG: 16S rRNA (cytidine(1402)-2'-O)-methyltransferase [Moraxella sp.]|nr:16S rRNA (cytidine(1402)-2'-O)-methyltransferase [Moraxella sp.]